MPTDLTEIRELRTLTTDHADTAVRLRDTIVEHGLSDTDYTLEEAIAAKVSIRDARNLAEATALQYNVAIRHLNEAVEALRLADRQTAHLIAIAEGTPR